MSSIEQILCSLGAVLIFLLVFFGIKSLQCIEINADIENQISISCIKRLFMQKFLGIIHQIGLLPDNYSRPKLSTKRIHGLLPDNYSILKLSTKQINGLLPHNIQLWIKFGTNTHILNIKSVSTIRTLLIQIKHQIHADIDKISISGLKPLVDFDKSLKYYNITDNTSIEAYISLKGGAWEDTVPA